ncbi:NADP-dependent malic enzyme [Bienertia sinuspersici]
MSGYSLLRDPHFNKGLAFSERERDAHYLRGLLPPAEISQQLQERNERLFYKLLVDNVEELLPIVYTPTVGEACQKYGSIFRHAQGLYISLKEKGRILEVLRNWPERTIQVIVVTDGERILGLGDLGCQCLPVTIDVGTNNEQMLKDDFYIGLRQKRATGQEYDELLDEFMSAVKQNYGEKVLIQFEDFANHNAFKLLSRYSTSHLVFNDDIQAGTGIAELIALEMSKQAQAPLDETRKKIWLVDSKGLIVSSRANSLQEFKKPWAHEHEPLGDLISAIKAIKPTVLIGSSGVGKTFTKEVVEAMASFNEVAISIQKKNASLKPLIMALSNPTTQSECTAEEAYTWTEGRAIFASGSPFDPVEYEGKTYVPGQANNAYIFPGLGLGLVIAGAIRVHDDMLLAASEALAGQVTQENYEKGMIYPPFSSIRKISAHIAANVAAKAYDLGLASHLPRPENLVKYAESCMYSPAYRSYR